MKGLRSLFKGCCKRKPHDKDHKPTITSNGNAAEPPNDMGTDGRGLGPVVMPPVSVEGRGTGEGVGEGVCGSKGASATGATGAAMSQSNGTQKVDPPLSTTA